MLQQVKCKGFSFQLGVFEVDGVFEFSAVEVERFIKFGVFETRIALKNGVFEAHAARELRVLEIRQVLKFHIAEIGIPGEFCVFEVRIVMKYGTGKTDFRRKFRVFEERLSPVGRFREIRSLIKFGIFERRNSLKLAPLKADIGMENSVMRLVFPVIMIIGNDIPFEGAVHKAQGTPDMVPEDFSAVAGAPVVFVRHFILDRRQIQVPDDFRAPIIDGFPLIDAFYYVFGVDPGLCQSRNGNKYQSKD